MAMLLLCLLLDVKIKHNKNPFHLITIRRLWDVSNKIEKDMKYGIPNKRKKKDSKSQRSKKRHQQLLN